MNLSTNNQSSVYKDSEDSLFSEDSADIAYGLESNDHEFFNGTESNFV